jgi:hypothetical protein
MTRKLRILRDEIRNEQFYYLDGVQVEPEDLIEPEESEEDEGEASLRDN